MMGRRASFIPRRAIVSAFAAAALVAGAASAAAEAPSGGGPALSEPPSPVADLDPDFAARREEIFGAFYATDLDGTAAYAVSDLLLAKDNVQLDFRQGFVFFMKPIEGETTGAVFIGEGEVSMTPPNAMGRYMLRKCSGNDVLKEPFTEAVMRFSDHSDRMLRAMGTPDPGGLLLAAQAANLLKDRNGLLDTTRELNLEAQFLENRISRLPDADFFLADLHTRNHKWLTYLHNPQRIQENFLATSETMGAQGKRYFVPWGIWHKPADYDRSGHYVALPERDGPRLLRTLHSEMSLNLPNTKTVEWETRLTIRPALGGLRCVRFDLDNNADSGGRWNSEYRPVRMVRAADAAGHALPFLHRKDQLLVLLPQPTRAGEAFQLTFTGTSEVIYQLTAESFGLLQNAWYPQYGYLDGRHSFDWTVRVPKTFLITGSGAVVREFADPATNQVGVELKSDLPISFPWVIFGRFQKASSAYASIQEGRSVPLTIHSFPTMTMAITDPETLERFGATRPIVFDLSAPTSKVRSFFEESQQILKLFETIYGPYPYDELHIAQMAPQLGFGQAPMGFVQLTGIAFLSQARLESDFVHGFLAHEIAHQWWGHQIGWASDADDWLSESFAEYASGIYVKELQGAKRFQRTLEIWKRNAKVSDAEAPIGEAFTLAGPNGGRHRYNLLYSKGPYVLHMLRVQLGDEKYAQVMRSIQETFRNRSITSEMLLSQVNRATGSDYTSFFEEWVWGTGIPSFRYSWRSEAQPDGRTLVVVHVSQQDKVNVKKVMMPVALHLKGTVQSTTLPIVQAEQDLRILAAAPPKSVTLDDDHTLLADVVKIE